ncbi:MAG: DUF4159 domain-containing protein [Gemmatimonadetes bacterium]|nr:DUF4159 domain-containing protein [Gemmatimonadota bacterium]
MIRTALALGIAGAIGLGASAGAGPIAVAVGAPTRQGAPDPENPPYDGRFAFVRLRYGARDASLAGGFMGGRGRNEPMWAHDLPRADMNFLRIMQELTSVQTAPEYHLVLSVDDPDLFRYPVAYIVEVGFWVPTDQEVQALRAWLLKGGFLIVDDFRGAHLDNFIVQMRRILPAGRFQTLEGGEEVFDSFFHIPDPHALAPPYDRQLVPVYLGLFENNDPARQLMVIANYNNDLAEYWEFSDYGYYPIDLANESYKFGVNYVMYGLTH